jgi:hypothetical protein
LGLGQPGKPRKGLGIELMQPGGQVGESDPPGEGDKQVATMTDGARVMIGERMFIHRRAGGRITRLSGKTNI